MSQNRKNLFTILHHMLKKSTQTALSTSYDVNYTHNLKSTFVQHISVFKNKRNEKFKCF